MTIFRNILGRSNGPYKNKSINLIYDLLFCDSVELYHKSGQNPEIYPWSIVLSKDPGILELEKIIKDNTLESRVRILAYHGLAARGVLINHKELLGIIIEMGMDKGVDVLAAYSDGTASYIDQSGKLAIRDVNDNKSNLIIKELFSHGENIINNTAPFDKPRLPYPENGMARLTFLVSGCFYLGQGPTGVLLEDKMGKPVLQSGTKLARYLIDSASKQH